MSNGSRRGGVFTKTSKEARQRGSGGRRWSESGGSVSRELLLIFPRCVRLQRPLTTDAPSPFVVPRIIHNLTSSPATSPYHPALYSPAFNSHSPLVQLTVTLPPSLSAFELPGKVRLGWGVLLGSMLGGGRADEGDGWDPSTGPW